MNAQTNAVESTEAVEKMHLIDPERARAYRLKMQEYARMLDVTGQ